MRKEIALPGVALGGGIAGFFVHRWLLNSAFEAESGLPIPGAPATWALFFLCLIVAAVLLALVQGHHRSFSGGYDRAFGAKGNTVYLLLMLLSALLLLAAGGFLMVSAIGAFGSGTVLSGGAGGLQGLLSAVFSVFLPILVLCTGGAVALMGHRAYRGEHRGKFSAAPLLPPSMACLWLLFSYIRNAGDPVKLHYVYTLLAIAAAVLAFYFMSGFAFLCPKVSSTIFFCLLSVYFSLAVLPAAQTTPDRLLLLFVLVYSMANATLLLFNDQGPRIPEQEEIEPEVTPNEG